jgi:hypothetical protein
MDAYNFLYLPAALEFRNREERVMFPPLVDAYAPTTTELEDVTEGQRHGPLQGGIRWDDEQGQLAFATMESEVGILLHTISSGATEVGADAGSRDNSPVPRAGQTFPIVIPLNVPHEHKDEHDLADRQTSAMGRTREHAARHPGKSAFSREEDGVCTVEPEDSPPAA